MIQQLYEDQLSAQPKRQPKRQAVQNEVSGAVEGKPNESAPLFLARYSGPNRSGICICGHKWIEHHLSVVTNVDYLEATHEAYLPQECEHYGFNECGGLKPNKETGRWENHCQSYHDSKETL